MVILFPQVYFNYASENLKKKKKIETEAADETKTTSNQCYLDISYTELLLF